MIYSTGFFITSCFDALKNVCQFAVDHNKPMLFNIAATFLVDFFKDQTMHCIEHADFVFCNEDEASHYAKAHDMDEKDRVAAAKHIAMRPKANDKRPRVAIVTQGADDVIIVEAQANSKDEPSVSYVKVPAIAKENIVDTNGAGDSFVGGFLAAKTQGKSIQECVEAGIAMSGIVVQRLGCQFE